MLCMQTTRETRATASTAEQSKKVKQVHEACSPHELVAVAVETSDAIGHNLIAF